MVLAAFFLLGAGALEVMALIPNQGPKVQPMSQSGSLVAAQIVLAAAFVITAGLCAVFVRRLALAGAVIAAAIVICDVGMVVSNIGTLLAYKGVGLAPWLQVAALVLGAAGAVCGLASQPPGALRRSPGQRSPVNATIAWLTFIASVLLGVALVPAWDRYAFVFNALGRRSTLLVGNPFSAGTSWVVAFGTMLTAVAFAVLPLLGALLRPARVGVLLTVGVVVVACSQTLSAVVGILHVKLNQFYSPLTARRASLEGVVVHGSLTWWFVVEVIAMLALLVLVVARWWTPAGGSLFDSYPVGVVASNLPPSMTWIHGSTAVNRPGTIGYGGVPPHGSRDVSWLPAVGPGPGPTGVSGAPVRRDPDVHPSPALPPPHPDA